VGRLTGALTLTRDDESLALRFIAGHIVSGSSGPVAGRLGEVLVRSGMVSRLDLDQALEQAAAQGRRLGPILVERGLVTRSRVEEALRLQVRGVLFQAFFWRRGAFHFEPDDGANTAQEEIGLRLSTAELILEAINAMEQTEAIREALGDLDRPLGAVDDPRLRLEGVTLSPSDAFVLSRADGTLTARQILAITPLPAETVERSLLALLSVGVVEWQTRHRSRPAPNPDQTVALSREAVKAAIASRKADEDETRLREIDATFAALAGKTHHDVLGLAPSATADEARAAYQKLTRRFHPDAVGSLPGEQAARVHAIFMRVSEAYNALRASAPVRRSAPVASGVASPATAPAASAAPAASRREPARPAPAASDPEAELREAQAALAERPWEALAAAERLLGRGDGTLRQQARLLKARAQLRNPLTWRAGEQELREILHDSPTFTDAILVLGSFYKDRGLQARAASMFRKVLEMEPRHRRALDELKDLPLAELGPMRFAARLAHA
jgi:hypothetical protein